MYYYTRTLTLRRKGLIFVGSRTSDFCPPGTRPFRVRATRTQEISTVLSTLSKGVSMETAETLLDPPLHTHTPLNKLKQAFVLERQTSQGLTAYQRTHSPPYEQCLYLITPINTATLELHISWQSEYKRLELLNERSVYSRYMPAVLNPLHSGKSQRLMGSS